MVTTSPTASADDDGPGLQGRRGARDLDADQLEQRPDAGGEPDAEQQSERTGDQPDHGRLDEDAREHLPAGRAHRAQQRDLAPPLRDQHVEGVPDDEGADHHRDAGEDEQHRGEDAQRVAHGCGAVGGDLLPRQRLHAVGEHRGDAVASSRALTPSAAMTSTSSTTPDLAQHLLGGGQVEPGEGGAQQAVGLPEADDRRPG